jgi:hypothetical protein
MGFLIGLVLDFCWSWLPGFDLVNWSGWWQAAFADLFRSFFA